MGTRSLIYFKNESTEAPVACVYQQFDGYPSCVGLELAKFINKFKIVNGYSMGDKPGKVANGMGCLAAQFVAEFKTDVGGLYLSVGGDCGQDYEYHVYPDLVIVKDPDTVIFTGSYVDFLAFCQEN